MVGRNRLQDRPVLRGTFLHYVEPDLLQAAMLELQSLGGAIRKVDDPAFYDRTPVIDLTHHRPAVVQVCDPYVASQRKRGMRGCHVVHLVIFAAGCGFAFEILAVPGSCAYLIRPGFRLFLDFGLNWSRFIWC